MADTGAWRRVVEEHGLVTEEGGSIEDRLGAVLGWLESLLNDVQVLEAVGAPARVVLWILVIAGASAIGVFLHRWLVARLRPARRPLTEALAIPREDTRARLEGALSAGRPREALAALVIWLASELAVRGQARWSSELTNAEVLASARRLVPEWRGLEALAELVRRVDVLLYGAEEPSMAQVRALVPRAEALLS